MTSRTITGKPMDAQQARRNLNPHAEAIVAMMIWSRRYAYEQTGGSMDFWDSLSAGEQRQCVEAVDRIKAAARAGRLALQEPRHDI